MLSMTNKVGVLWMVLGVGSAMTVCAQQRITPSEAARLQRQNVKEMQELQKQMTGVQRENLYVVRDASVVEIEARREYELKRAGKKEVQQGNGVDARSPEARAKVDEALMGFNAQLPKINASLKQVFSNSPLSQVELKAMRFDDVVSSARGNDGIGQLSGQQAINQAINQAVNQRLQEEIKKIDPRGWDQMQAVLKATKEGKSISLPQNGSRSQQSQLMPKGTP